MPVFGWQPSWRLRLLLSWTSVTFVAGWLPFVRGPFDGATYEWGTSYFGRAFGGAGAGGDYWLAAVKVGFALLLLVLGWRGARTPFPQLIVGWQAFGLADALHEAITSEDPLRIRGDTLGMDVSLAWVAPTLYAAALVLAIVWFRRERANRLERDPGWPRANWAWLAALAALLPLQFLLLQGGGPGSGRDQIGVVLTIAQWFLLPLALRVRSS